MILSVHGAQGTGHSDKQRSSTRKELSLQERGRRLSQVQLLAGAAGPGCLCPVCPGGEMPGHQVSAPAGSLEQLCLLAPAPGGCPFCSELRGPGRGDASLSL